MGNAPGGAAAATSRVASSQCSAPRVSVVVPARNEAVLLPRLLESLAKQTRPPDEVVVADALSVDETVEVARELGALVVRGGPPAVGRNAGACATTGELLLFLDADVVPGPGFVADAVGEFTRRRLDVATAPIAPVEQAWDFRVAYRIIGLWLRAVSRISPHAVGACILVRRDLHDRLGGFDETLALAEDHDYVRRGAALARFGVLRSVRIPTSMRRVLRQGRLRFARIMLASELRMLARRPVHTAPPGWELGGLPDDEPRDRPRRRALRRWRRELARPSSEVQGDAIGLAAASALASLLAAGAPIRWGRAAALAGGCLALASSVVALRPVRQERSYGRFFSATVAVASHDVPDASGAPLVRAGEDLVCELHAVHHLADLATLRRQGHRGRLAARLEILEGIRALADSFDDPHYDGVRAVIARSGIARALVRIGFVEVPAPPRFDLINALEKRILGLRTGAASEPGGVIPDCLVVMPREQWLAVNTRVALDSWIARTRAEFRSLL